MVDIEKVLLDLVKPICNDPDGVMVKQMQSLQENEVILYVYAPSEDIARLIGRQGMMANSIRQLMSVCGRLNDKKLDIKFESYGE